MSPRHTGVNRPIETKLPHHTRIFVSSKKFICFPYPKDYKIINQFYSFILIPMKKIFWTSIFWIAVVVVLAFYAKFDKDL